MIDKEIREAVEKAAERYATGDYSASFPDSAEKRAYLAGALEFGAKWAEWARADERARVLRYCGRLYLTNAAWCDAAEKYAALVRDAYASND